MKVKNEAQKWKGSEMDGLFVLPCELICSNASLWDKYAYMSASVILQAIGLQLYQGYTTKLLPSIFSSYIHGHTTLKILGFVNL